MIRGDSGWLCCIRTGLSCCRDGGWRWGWGPVSGGAEAGLGCGHHLENPVYGEGLVLEEIASHVSAGVDRFRVGIRCVGCCSADFRFRFRQEDSASSLPRHCVDHF